jgi:AGZA family xanthine/uracil permease-like MFS transporter
LTEKTPTQTIYYLVLGGGFFFLSQLYSKRGKVLSDYQDAQKVTPLAEDGAGISIVLAKEQQESPKISLSVEISAGLTTFLSMAYVMSVNPIILSGAGMDIQALFTATVLGVILATVLMAAIAKLPFAVAPGMGLNAFFVVIATTMGFTWQQALTAVLISGILFVAISFSPLREKVIREVPKSLQHAVAAGIGIMIAHIGLFNAKIAVTSPIGQYSLGVLTQGPGLLAIIGLAITGILLALRIKFALLLGIIITTLIGIPLGVTDTSLVAQKGFISAPASIAPIAFHFDFSILTSWTFWGIVFTLLFMEVFDGLAGFIGLFTVMGSDSKFYRPRLGKAFIADSLGVVAGACVGVSPNTTYAESGSGIANGGRTGITALTVAVLFALCLLFSNLFLTVPSSAVAPALIMVGLLMTTSLQELNFSDITETFPAFVIVVVIAFTLRISDGLALGWILFIIMKLLARKREELTTTVWVVGAIFLLKIILVD